MLEELWDSAVVALGGRPGTAGDLAARYGEPHRRYHGTRHVLAVARDVVALADDVTERERAVLVLAALAHDVVYDGEPGHDERASAAWAAERLAAAGVDAAEVVRLVLATVDHEAGDRLAALLTDADLGVLGSAPADYGWYRAAVRAEYAHVPDDAWRDGRSRVLRSLLERDPLYATAAARDRWEVRARANLAAELASLSDRPRARRTSGTTRRSGCR
ncbi:HD domain-containing protein [Saccharothrix obliqua]|uniref:HD domain-containing protein n=1 Tax=Saccharothrix obliqua TaxID=2861747 RepID=UPI001C5F5350|nr:HD domain-containing protein [Saccharothrix obliqua]MBW4720642.1 HD domain-containing protein [Saccharothrix obliqua]